MGLGDIDFNERIKAIWGGGGFKKSTDPEITSIPSDEHFELPIHPLPPDGPTGEKRGKYHNIPTFYGGVRYSSKGEADHARRLDQRKESGEIRGWIRQVKFTLGIPENVAIVDFLVFGKDGYSWAEEYKGKETASFKKIKKLWPKYAPCDMVIVKGEGDVVEKICSKHNRIVGLFNSNARLSGSIPTVSSFLDSSIISYRPDEEIVVKTDVKIVVGEKVYATDGKVIGVALNSCDKEGFCRVRVTKNDKA